jgi:hypothetical protein
MKLLRIITLVLVPIVAAQAQERQCVETQFAGEATQLQEYSQQLDERLAFSVNPMRLREDPRWAWFQIRVAPNDGDAIVVFNPGDSNWLLNATDFWSVFIGGPDSDLNAALQYRSRYLLFPIAAADKQAARDVARLVTEAKTSEEIKRAVAALNAMRLAQVRFEITDYVLGKGQHSRSVESVKFDVKLIVPTEFRFSEKVPSIFVECPAIPRKLVENLRHRERHKHLLAVDDNPRP